MRKIIHLDMDAFFASVEQHDHPELRGKPVIIGGSSARRGVVSTCSYEARAYGVHSAMATARAEKLCPQGIYLPGNMDRYREVSAEIRAIFLSITDLVEPLSIDEAFLDVTENSRNCRSATKLARELQREIFDRTGLTASAGVSYNKFLAKVASGIRKPAGLTVITPEEAPTFLEALPIEKFFGIGKVTAARLKRMNIRNGRDLKQLELPLLCSLFGKSGAFYYHIVRGIDERPVEPDTGERKSIGRETTFANDLSDWRLIKPHLHHLTRDVCRTLQHQKLAGKTISVKIRYENFQTATRSATFHTPLDTANAIEAVALELLHKTELPKRKIRLLGVTVSNFPSEAELARPVQLEFDF